MADNRGRSRAPTVMCPRCGGKANSTARRLISDRLRQVHYRCVDEACGIRFVCSIQMEYIIGMPADVGDLGLPVVLPRTVQHDPPEMMAQAA